MPKQIAVFPGSFDPFTLGHFDIVVRSLRLFDEVIIAVGHNSQKKRYFPIETMISKIEEAFAQYSNVSIQTYDELTADFAKRAGARVIIRGLRNTTDFEYENSISQVNRYLNEELETIFFITSPKYAPISSSIIREVHKYGGDVRPFLPYEL